MKPAWFQRETAKIGCADLTKVLTRLKACPPQTRCAVGAGVHMANDNFIRRFTGIESFRGSPAPEKERFWLDLGDLELGLRSVEAGMAMGVGLYRIWLADALAGHHQLAGPLGEELAELSRER